MEREDIEICQIALKLIFRCYVRSKSGSLGCPSAPQPVLDVPVTYFTQVLEVQNAHVYTNRILNIFPISLVDSTIPKFPKSEISSLYESSVSVQGLVGNPEDRTLATWLKLPESLGFHGHTLKQSYKRTFSNSFF